MLASVAGDTDGVAHVVQAIEEADQVVGGTTTETPHLMNLRRAL